MRMRLSGNLIVTASAIQASCLPVVGQEPVNPLPETRIALRVSGESIRFLEGTRIEREETIDAIVDGAAV